MNRTTAAMTAGILLALTGCTSSSDDAKPKAAPSPAASTPEYTAADCRALLERSYEADAPSDVSAHPECAHLPHDQYIELASSVIAGHKDDIINDASNEIAWDQAWDATPTEQQEVVCDRLITDGTDIVGQELADAAAEPSGDEADMAAYFLDEKC
ncbi:hypothetical protein C5F59_027520 [Streptomyces sp. QL37]|uniref:hypothetical protein n=1 Tax=Streptomyces sp. QL37 TaxID=2093747 RepID=UPI000CF221C7|nr:hypothetical protein [Streptomyces sp. QL37]PPQ57134.1 hypothetical protein C5F59_10905 [Streptomyces sp. QL37]